MSPAVWWHARCSRHAGGRLSDDARGLSQEIRLGGQSDPPRVAAWLLAKTVNTAIGAAIRPTPRVDLGAGQSAASAPAMAILDVDKLYPLIGQKPPPVVVAGTGPDLPPPPKTCSDPPGRAGRHLASRAAHRRHRGREAAPVGRGHRRQGDGTDQHLRDRRRGAGSAAALRGADPDSVDPSGRASRVVAIVCHDGRKEYVDFGTGGGGVAVPVSAPTSAWCRCRPRRSSVGSPVDGIKKVATTSTT